MTFEEKYKILIEEDLRTKRIIAKELKISKMRKDFDESYPHEGIDTIVGV